MSTEWQVALAALIFAASCVLIVRWMSRRVADPAPAEDDHLLPLLRSVIEHRATGADPENELLSRVLEKHRDDDPVVLLDILTAPDTAWEDRSLLELIAAGDAERVQRYLARQERDGFP
ncbi:hypothetical protein ATO8_18050 [Roseivivax marinus]|uniref:Uncharacterized protein n=1 Tax=Roseivivax marinus TaxID=1379903 RepID=W4HEN0_9RHOB|nr:hypothetical protein [Roseivivax marinus]ETW11232.1 hypothetical protein ATO8_18050 [Roseivivax marinus]UMA67430.1 hypothetical protein LVO79_21520 [Roseivivax marinus]